MSLPLSRFQPRKTASISAAGVNSGRRKTLNTCKLCAWEVGVRQASSSASSSSSWFGLVWSCLFVLTFLQKSLLFLCFKTPTNK